MASEQEVKKYLAYWFQLGKRLLINKGQTAVLPKPVIQGERYSQEFEDCWQQILCVEGNCHLEGTDETIAELLTPAWEMSPCSRCQMLVPVRSVGMPPLSCPCNDLSSWPNMEVPAPRQPINTQVQLQEIRNRLINSKGEGASRN